MKSENRLASQDMNLHDKISLLESIGRRDLIEIFQGYEQKRKLAQPKPAPIDQRVAISVTPLERVQLTNTLKELVSEKSKQSVSSYIRSKAIQTIDLQGWREIAVQQLDKLKEIENNKKLLKKQREELISLLESKNLDDDDFYLKEKQLVEIDNDLKLLIAQQSNRSNRLNGRMTMKEAEIVRWRSQRLCLSVSDYLRIMLFDFTPASMGDAHLSKEARERFYVSIIDVCDNGWGSPKNVYECSQCIRYVEKIHELENHIKQLENR